jgi:hypothetical protein
MVFDKVLPIWLHLTTVNIGAHVIGMHFDLHRTASHDSPGGQNPENLKYNTWLIKWVHDAMQYARNHHPLAINIW